MKDVENNRIKYNAKMAERMRKYRETEEGRQKNRENARRQREHKKALMQQQKENEMYTAFIEEIIKDLKAESSYTLDYYNQNSESFTSTTVDVEFSEIQDTFLSYLKEGSLILDFGCGSGRDTRYFLKKGYQVEATDGSEELVKVATKNTGIQVKQMLFQELDETEKYDGIFACASILHVSRNELPDVMTRMHKALKKNGIMYVSFKYGSFEGERNGRFFTDMTEELFDELLKEIPPLKIEKENITEDVRPGRSNEKWLNVYLRKTDE